jgi:hypothetical protein
MTHVPLANRRWYRVLSSLGAAIIMLVMGLLPAAAQTTTSAPMTDLKPYLVSVPPRGTVTVAVDGNCLNYGLPFPGAALKLTGLADDKIRTAIAYSLAKGYHTAEGLPQAQQAVWYFTDKQSVTGDKLKLAQEIVAYVEGGAKPKDLDARSLSLVDAVKQGLVAASVGDFKNISNPAYFGKGTLTITNLSDKTQTLHLPYGMIFQDAQKTGVQSMAIFPATLPQAQGATLAAADSVCNQVTIKLPASASTKLLVQGYCQNYGLPFPSKSLTPVKLAADVIRNTICYNQAKGYTESDLWQAQLAVWRQTDKLDQGAAYPLVNEIAPYAQSGVKPGDIGPSCVSLPDAIEKKLVSAEISDYTDISDKAYFGKGTMVVKNLTGQEQTLCIPYGTIFKDAGRAGTQDMAIFPAARPAAEDAEAQKVAEAKAPPAVLPATGAPLAVLALSSLGLIGLGLALRRQQW